ncbi:MAG: cell division protein FtsL [Alkalispirochaetaceae bacterium]
MRVGYLLAGAALITGLLLVNVWQSYRYEVLEGSVALLEETQEEIVEANKRTIAEITSLLSPTRIRRLATEELGMSPVPPEDIYRIEVKPRE